MILWEYLLSVSMNPGEMQLTEKHHISIIQEDLSRLLHTSPEIDPFNSETLRQVYDSSLGVLSAWEFSHGLLILTLDALYAACR